MGLSFESATVMPTLPPSSMVDVALAKATSARVGSAPELVAMLADAPTATRRVPSKSTRFMGCADFESALCQSNPSNDDRIEPVEWAAMN